MLEVEPLRPPEVAETALNLQNLCRQYLGNYLGNYYSRTENRRLPIICHNHRCRLIIEKIEMGSNF